MKERDLRQRYYLKQRNYFNTYEEKLIRGRKKGDYSKEAIAYKLTFYRILKLFRTSKIKQENTIT